MFRILWATSESEEKRKCYANRDSVVSPRLKQTNNHTTLCGLFASWQFFSSNPLPQWLIAPPSGSFPIPKKDNCHVNFFFGILSCCTRKKQTFFFLSYQGRNEKCHRKTDTLWNLPCTKAKFSLESNFWKWTSWWIADRPL